jgi:lipopolysaccharide/colanic/teichoic acid biosynthesis glycosyltransferase
MHDEFSSAKVAQWFCRLVIGEDFASVEKQSKRFIIIFSLKVLKQYLENIHPEAIKLIEQYADMDSDATAKLDTTNYFNVRSYPIKIKALINFGLINQMRYINKFFEEVNAVLEIGDVFICRGETIVGRKERLQISNYPMLGKLYFFFEFIFLRVIPKLWGLKKIFFWFTRGKIRLISKAEILGRLYSCGFELVEYRNIEGELYVVCRKRADPDYNMEPSYGPIFKMRRLGKNGNIIGVYKFRTMHPYAEYLQDYIINQNGYSQTGKPKDDFRLTPWGRFFRKYWIDELPQLINVFKGEMKLVGLRPISERYAQDIDPEFLKERIQYKPGCIPPYISLNRASSVSEVIQAEKEYLDAKKRSPFTADLKFFFQAVFNIVFRRKRSA